jgi:hypothetical protein
MTRAFGIVLLLPVLAFAGDVAKGREIVLSRADGNCLLCHAVPIETPAVRR